MAARRGAGSRSKTSAKAAEKAAEKAATKEPAKALVKPQDPSLVERLRLEVEHAVQRGLKSVELLGAPPPVVGRTPKTVMVRRGTYELVHYHAQASEVYRVPVLAVMAPTNKAYILDLAPGQSLVEFLLQRGYDLYLIDWNAPTAAEAELDFDDYVLDFIPDAIRRVREDSGEPDLTLLGYCAGGMLSALYQALHPEGAVRNLVCFTTPVDFSHMQVFRSLADVEHFDVDRFVDGVGIVPAATVLSGFEALRPASRVAGPLRLWDNLWNDPFVDGYRRMQRWTSETLPLAGGYFRQTVKDLLQRNALYEGTLRIGGRPVDLGRITVPLLHVTAEYDHIVPPACARPLVERAASRDKQELMLPGGHVSIAAGASAVRRMWPVLDTWLQERST